MVYRHFQQLLFFFCCQCSKPYVIGPLSNADIKSTNNHASQISNNDRSKVSSAKNVNSTAHLISVPNRPLLATTFPFTIPGADICGTMCEFSDDIFTLNVVVINGTIEHVNHFPGLWIRHNGHTELSISGALQDLQILLNKRKLKYNPPRNDWVGNASFRLSLSGPTDYFSSALINLSVRPKFEMELSVLPDQIDTLEDEIFSFSSRSIELLILGVTNQNYLQCSMSTMYGKLSENSINGTSIKLRQDFSSIRYLPYTNFNGIDTVGIQCKNDIGQFYKTEATIIIRPVNDLPEIVLPHKYFRTGEDEIVTLGHDVGIFVIDSDAHESQESKIAVDLTISVGAFSLPHQTELGQLFTVGDNTSNLLIVGPVDRTNKVLQEVKISFPIDWFGSGSIAIKCTDTIKNGIEDYRHGREEWVTHSIGFAVESVNDAPNIVIRHKTVFTTREDQPLMIENGSILIYDTDSSAKDELQLTFSISKNEGFMPGYFVLGKFEGRDADNVITSHHSRNTFNSSTLIINGTVSDISKSVKYVQFLPKENWNGWNIFTITASDANGDSTKIRSTISVLPVNDSPKFLSSTQNLTSKEDYPVSIGEVMNIKVFDADTTHDPFLVFYVSVNTSFGGTVHLSNYVPGCFISSGHTYDSPTTNISFQGIIDVINDALTSLIYTPLLNMDSFETLSFHVRDHEDLFDEMNLKIDFLPENDPPTIVLPHVESIVNTIPKVCLKGMRIIDIDGYQTDIMTLSINLLPREEGKFQFPMEINREIVYFNENYSDSIFKGTEEALNSLVEEIWVIDTLHASFERNCTLIISITDAFGSSTERSMAVNIKGSKSLPKMTVNGTTLTTFEDSPLYLGKILFLMNESFNDDSVFEIQLRSKNIAVLDLQKISIRASSTCLSRKIRGEYMLELGSEMTRPINVDASEETIKDALMQLSIISAVEISRVESHVQSLSFILKVLVFTDAMSHSIKEVSIINHSLKGDSDELLPCDIVINVTPLSVSDKAKLISEIWKIPSLELGRFQFAKLSFGGVQFPSRELAGDSTPGIVMRGPLASLNDALKEIIYLPPTNFFGNIKVEIKLASLNEYSQQSEAIIRHIDISVQSIDDFPRILWNEDDFLDDQIVLEVDEDSMIQFGRLSIWDVDCGLDVINVELNSTSGNICVSENSELSFGTEIYHSVDEFGSALSCCNSGGALDFRGDIYEVNQALATLTYIPSSDWWGHEIITISVLSNNFMVSKRVHIVVKNIPDTPVITLQHFSLTTKEDSPLAIDIVSFSDGDCLMTVPCPMEVDLKVSNGTLRMKKGIESFANPVQSEVMSGRSFLRLRGSLNDLNESIRNLIYDPLENYFGKDTLSIHAREMNGWQVDKSIHIYITPVNDSPVVVLPKAPLIAFEDTEGIIGSDERCNQGLKSSSHITCSPIKIYDPDTFEGNGNDEASTMVTLSSSNGSFKLPQLNSHHDVEILAGSSNEFSSIIQFRGSVDGVNLLLDGLFYKGNQNFNTMYNYNLEKIAIEVEDGSGLFSTATLFLEVKPVNDLPVILIKNQKFDRSVSTGDGLSFMRTSCQPISVREDTHTPITGISVRDVDVIEEFIEIRLTCFNGTILLDYDFIHYWIIGSSKTYFQTMTARGTVENLNEALETLVYRPNAQFSGSDTLEIHVSDLGNIGLVSNPISTDTAIIPIYIEAERDDPVILAPTTIQAKEDTPKQISISISHEDSNDTNVFFSIDCNHGKVTFDSLEGISLTGGMMNGSSYIAGIASVHYWNLAIDLFVYTPEENWNTHSKKFDEIKLIVRNFEDNFESTSISHTILVNVEAVNDSPELIVPNRKMRLLRTGGFVVDSVDTIQVEEDGNSLITPISILDPDVLDDSDIHSFFVSVKIFCKWGYIKLFKDDGLFFVQGSDNSKKIEFRATYKLANQAIQELSYHPRPNFYGEDFINLHVSDEGNIGAGTKISSILIPINVTSTRDTPKILTQNILTCREETWCKTSGIKIEDPDENALLLLEIKSGHGSIAFANGDLESTFRSIEIMEGLTSGDDFIKLTGKCDDINAVLINLAYIPVIGSSGSSDFIHFLVSVNESPGISSTNHINIIVLNTLNNGPFIHYTGALHQEDEECDVFNTKSKSTIVASGKWRESISCDRLRHLQSFHCEEDLDCPMRGLTISDPDSKTVTFKLEVQEGMLKIENELNTPHLVERNISGQKDAFLRGSPEYINLVLKNLVYRGSPNFFGIDTLHLLLADEVDDTANQKTHEITIDIIVSGSEDPLLLLGPTHVHEANEDSFLSINGLKVTHERHRQEDYLSFVQARINSMNGRFRFHATHGVNFTIPSVESENKWHFARNGFWYGITDSEIPHKMTASTDNFSYTMGDSDQNWWSEVTMCGKLDDINRAIANITFLPDENWNSEVHGLTEVNLMVTKSSHCEWNAIVTEEYGNSDNFSVMIYIHSENDLPFIATDGDYGQEKYNYHGSNDDYVPNTNGFIVDDVAVPEDNEFTISTVIGDVDNDILKIELTSNLGYISLARLSKMTSELPYRAHNSAHNVYFIVGDSENFHDKIIFTGPVDYLNSYLSEIRFRGRENFHGNGSFVEVKIEDSTGGTSSKVIPITITPVDDITYLWLPVDASLKKPIAIVNEGETLKLGSNWLNSDFMEMRVSKEERFDDDPYLRSGAGKAFSLSNDDYKTFSSTTLCIEISITKGILSVDNKANVSFEDDLSKGAIIRFSGVLDALNAVGENVIISMKEGDAGFAQFRVKVLSQIDDQEHIGRLESKCPDPSHPVEVEGFLDIHVVAVNAAPIIQCAQKIIEAKIDVVNHIAGISIHDSDASEKQAIDAHTRVFEGFVTVTANVSRGVVGLATTFGLSFTIGNALGGDRLEFHGSLANVNSALETLEYICKKVENECTEDTKEILTLHVNDNGNTGKGGALQHEINVQIHLRKADNIALGKID